MEYSNYTAKSVDEAITQACIELGVSSDRLDYSVIQEASRGFLGMGSKPAVIRARIREEEKAYASKSAKEAVKKAEPAKKEEAAKPAEEEKKSGKPAEAPAKAQPERRIITNDEIEKRAKEAEERAKAAGIVIEDRPDRDESRPRRGDRRGGKGRDRNDRGGRGRNDRRRDDRHAVRTETVEVVPHEPSKPKPDRVVKERSEEEVTALITAAEVFLKDVFKAMNITVEMTISYDAAEGSVNCTFAGEEMGLLIGKRGQTLDSIQYLTSLVINKTTEDYVRVKLDTEDYRSRRADTLNNLARNIAYKVKKTRRAVALEPMNPYERRIIHSALQSSKFVETYSEGEEPYRHVVVAPKR